MKSSAILSCTLQELECLSDGASFHHCDQATFFEILEKYVDRYGLDIDRDTLHAEAIEWSMTRGARSGRVAWQYIQDLAGRQQKTLD